MNNILQQIVKTKIEEIEIAKRNISLSNIKIQAYEFIKKNKTRNFIEALSNKHKLNLPAVIAEIKQASPSKGIICKNFDVKKIAKSYADNGAACLSVLTDEKYFHGHKDYLHQAHMACNLPILRKDFIIDEYQIYQSCLMGADAILLIASILTKEQMKNFNSIAINLNLAVLPEIHHNEELEKALNLNTPMIGINNRNLSDFSVDLQQTINLLPKINDKIIVTESGILTKNDIKLMQLKNVNSFLVGEAFMKENDCGIALKNLFFTN